MLAAAGFDETAAEPTLDRLRQTFKFLKFSHPANELRIGAAKEVIAAL